MEAAVGKLPCLEVGQANHAGTWDKTRKDGAASVVGVAVRLDLEGVGKKPEVAAAVVAAGLVAAEAGVESVLIVAVVDEDSAPDT